MVPPWAEEYELQLNGGECPSAHWCGYAVVLNIVLEEQWIDEFSDDKLRRIRHELNDGDSVEDVCSVTRIVGVDSSRKSFFSSTL